MKNNLCRKELKKILPRLCDFVNVPQYLSYDFVKENIRKTRITVSIKVYLCCAIFNAKSIKFATL